jgi:hypothetical protein
MARTKLNIVRAELLKVIEDLEKIQEFTNIQNLALAVSETDWAKNYQPKPVTAPVVTLRIDEFDFINRKEIKTRKGKRGRQSGVKLSAEQKTKMVNGRINKTLDEVWLAELTKIVPTRDAKGNKTDRFTKILKRAKQGSVKAIIKLKCLECSGWDATEVKNCTCISCPLYGIRPYKLKAVA